MCVLRHKTISTLYYNIKMDSSYMNIFYRASTNDFILNNGLRESVYSLCQKTNTNVNFYILLFLEEPNQKLQSFFQKIQKEFSHLKINYNLLKLDFSLLPKKAKDFKIKIVEKSWGWWANLDENLIKEQFLEKLQIAGLCAPYLVGECDKVLVLGADTLILDDISKVYNTDLSEKIYASPRDASTYSEEFYTRYNLDRSIKNPEFYTTGDFILFNVKKYKEENCFENLLCYIENNIDLCKAYDQDSLYHSIPSNKKIILNKKWNVVPMFYNYLEVPKTDIGMLHFCGTKPYRKKLSGLKYFLKKTSIIMRVLFTKKNYIPYFVGMFNKYHSILKRKGYYS